MTIYRILMLTCLFAATAGYGFAAKIVLQAEEGSLNAERAEVVGQSSFKTGKGVALKDGVEDAVDADDAPADVVFRVRAPEAGRYVVRTHAAVDEAGRAVMEKARTKHESIFMRIAVADGRPTKRVVFVPWASPDSSVQTTGKFDLTGGEDEVRVWLPDWVRLDYIELIPYVPPAVPKAAAGYEPAITPPASHPRLWVNAESLPKVRENLTSDEHAPLWKKVREAAAKPYEFKVEPGERVSHNSALEAAVVNKAFVYLMTGEEASGREAVELADAYLEAVEFNNLLDITREIGRAIYAGARVYDWCYDLLTSDEKQRFLKNFMRLSDDMEIGWPPYKQSVVNGHGSEAQLHCYLLSMAIAIYDEDPVPYQYCAYRILEELVPMRNFEYQSPRHHQGIGYGIYRFAWDLHAALLFERMSGEKIFDAGIESVHKHWLYMRLPNGHSLPDGDGNYDGRPANLGMTALLAAAYADDPVMKWDFQRQGGLPHDPVLVMLLNDPAMEAADGLGSLPLTLDFEKVLGGMVARTGWDMGGEASDVVVAMTGGGYHFANHQHADAGSLQVYYHGVQVADLGQYVFYGTPYDMNFNKRSVSHSMMLAYDPDEVVAGGRREADGGARFGFSSPRTVKQVTTSADHANGSVVSADFGPSEMEPDFSYFSVDLESAYSDKIRDYVRTFCFVNFKDEATPAALIVFDNMVTTSPEITKYWQINTLNPPEKTDTGVVLTSTEYDQTGKVSVQMLMPGPENRSLEILSGKDANSVFGTQYDPPQPERPTANGHRVMFSPKEPAERDLFLTVLSMHEEDAQPVEASLDETSDTLAVALRDWVVVLSKSGRLLDTGFDVAVDAEDDMRLLLTGLNPGTWRITSEDGNVSETVEVVKDKNTAQVSVAKGNYRVEPQR